jgi:NhaP-type Na+/H+ or K+/H+ antiporter
VQFDRWLAVSGALSFGALLLSGLLRRLPLSGPLMALVAGVALGPDVLGVLQPGPHADTVTLLGTEVVLAVSLMAVALRFPVRELRDVVVPLGWLLSVVTLGMAAVVAVAAMALFDLEAAPAALLGVALAPTDPVLASSVVTGAPAERALPGRLRRMLSTESGANDGLAWPLTVVMVALVLGDGLVSGAVEAVWGLAAALGVGVGLGAAAGRALRWARDRREIETSGLFVATIALAIVLLAVTELVGGDGVLAVFVGGLAYNAVAGREVFDEEVEVDEGIHRVLVLPLFVLIGATLPWQLWADESTAALAAFVIVALVLRRLPLVLALRRPLGLGLPDATFLGWFGPIGVAAVYYLAFARDRAAAGDSVVALGLAVVAASTVVHGISATPGRLLYERLHPVGSSQR